MRKFKKFFALVLMVLPFSFILTGCGKVEGNTYNYSSLKLEWTSKATDAQKEEFANLVKQMIPQNNTQQENDNTADVTNTDNQQTTEITKDNVLEFLTNYLTKSDNNDFNLKKISFKFNKDKKVQILYDGEQQEELFYKQTNNEIKLYDNENLKTENQVYKNVECTVNGNILNLFTDYSFIMGETEEQSESENYPVNLTINFKKA